MRKLEERKLTDEERKLVEQHYYLIDEILADLDDDQQNDDYYGLLAVELCNLAKTYISEDNKILSFDKFAKNRLTPLLKCNILADNAKRMSHNDVSINNMTESDEKELSYIDTFNDFSDKICDDMYLKNIFDILKYFIDTSSHKKRCKYILYGYILHDVYGMTYKKISNLMNKSYRNILYHCGGSYSSTYGRSFINKIMCRSFCGYVDNGKLKFRSKLSDIKESDDYESLTSLRFGEESILKILSRTRMDKDWDLIWCDDEKPKTPKTTKDHKLKIEI